MSDHRFPDGRRPPQPRARFRCQQCARFVIATEHGVCPGCGLGPPAVHVAAGATAAGAGPRAVRVWSPAYVLLAALFSLVVGLLAAAWAVGLL